MPVNKYKPIESLCNGLKVISDADLSGDTMKSLPDMELL